MLSEPIQVTLKVVMALERLEIPYLIGGPLASTVYGIIRATMDADLVADIKPDHIPLLVSILALLQQGETILDTVYQTGYFDQPHLT